MDTFRESLNDLGYIENQSVVIEWRFTNGGPDRLQELAAELVRLNVDVILAASFEPARTAQAVTRTVPIVVGATNDPVASGLVASLARPGGNLTGLSLVAPLLSAKRLELLKEAVPHVTHVAVLADPRGATVERDWQETQRAAQLLRLQLQRLDVQDPAGYSEAFEAATRECAQALLMLPTVQFGREYSRIAELALNHQLPALGEDRRFAATGGLLSYGANMPSLYRRAAVYVDKILKGTKPADIPIEQPMRFDLVINLETAQALGLTLPYSTLIQATEIIQ